MSLCTDFIIANNQNSVSLKMNNIENVNFKNNQINFYQPITASRDTLESGYSKTADSDTDNSGRSADAVSYKYYWATGDFNATGILGGCIHDNASPVNATKLLTHWTFSASFSKTANDTLTLFVNHTMNGV